LRDGISGDEVDQEENEADHQPDYGQGVEDALEDGFQSAVLRSQSLVYGVILSGANSNELA
jgi:hypothetical protein